MTPVTEAAGYCEEGQEIPERTRSTQDDYAHWVTSRRPPRKTLLGAPTPLTTARAAEGAVPRTIRGELCKSSRPVGTFIYNVTFDCREPRTLARFWAEVTGYSIAEERDDFVRLRAPDKRGIRHILFFQVPEPKTHKNRMHVDLASPDPGAEIERLRHLGATLVDGNDLVWRAGNGTRWVVMRDPEGNEFCLG